MQAGDFLSTQSHAMNTTYLEIGVDLGKESFDASINGKART